MGLCPEKPIAELFSRPLSDHEVRKMWYDWFCEDRYLVRKGRKLLERLARIALSPRFNPRETYVFFKNNCPLHGRLYDDFRICRIGDGEVLYCVIPSEGYDGSKGQAAVWGNHPVTGEFEELARGTWKDVVAFFRETDEVKLLAMVEETRRYNLIKEAEWHNANRTMIQ